MIYMITSFNVCVPYFEQVYPSWNRQLSLKMNQAEKILIDNGMLVSFFSYLLIFAHLY